jgi:hypothetical protein
MPYKFGVNTTNLVLMPKKTNGGSHYNFIFSKIKFYVRLGKRQENLQGKPLAFSFFLHRRIKGEKGTFLGVLLLPLRVLLQGTPRDSCLPPVIIHVSLTETHLSLTLISPLYISLNTHRFMDARGKLLLYFFIHI